MDSFSKLLDEALEQTDFSHSRLDEFMKFATALITSTSVDKIPVAIERAMALSPAELASVVKQVQFTGDMQALYNAMDSKPEYAAQFVELGRKILPEKELLAFVEQFKGATSIESGDECPGCGSRLTYDDNNGELECDPYNESHRGCGHEFKYCGNCDKWFSLEDFNEDQDLCHNCHEDPDEEPYNAEADYYNQGDDGLRGYFAQRQLGGH